MKHSEPRFDELVAIPWGAGEVLGYVHEVYGHRDRRYVVVRLEPELSQYVVDAPTTVTFPLDEVRKAADREIV